jgi:TPR repeat protein
LALVRLGNDALKGAIEESTESTVPLLDEDRYKAWIHESPINLKQLLVLFSNCKNGTSVLIEENMHCAKYLSPYQQLAAHLYEEAGKQGSPEGYYNLGHLLWDVQEKEGNDNTLGDEAFDAFYKSMQLGDVDAIYFLAVQYLSCDENTSASSHVLYDTIDKALKKDMSTSEEAGASSIEILPLELESDINQTGYHLLLKAALRHEHGPAMHHLALLHQIHNHDDSEFCKILSRAAALGHPESLFLQGHCLYHGSDGYSEDFQAALDNFLDAAELGHVDAMVSAGAMLHGGVRTKDGKSFIVERDQQRAFDLYQQAGELGSVEGWRNVVHCYATGQGVPMCLESAKHIAETMLREDYS